MRHHNDSQQHKQDSALRAVHVPVTWIKVSYNWYRTRMCCLANGWSRNLLWHCTSCYPEVQLKGFLIASSIKDTSAEHKPGSATLAPSGQREPRTSAKPGLTQLTQFTMSPIHLNTEIPSGSLFPHLEPLRHVCHADLVVLVC